MKKEQQEYCPKNYQHGEARADDNVLPGTRRNPFDGSASIVVTQPQHADAEQAYEQADRRNRQDTHVSGLRRQLSLDGTIDTVIFFSHDDDACMRLLPALDRLVQDGLLQRLGLGKNTSAAPRSPADCLPPVAEQSYFHIGPDNALPLHQMDRGGWLGPNVLAYIAPSGGSQSLYAEQLLGTKVGIIAVEDPLSNDLAEACLLAQLGRGKIHPVVYPLFKKAASEFLASCGDRDLGSVDSVEFHHLQTAAAGGHNRANAIWNTAYLGLSVIVAVFRTAGFTPKIQPTVVRVGRYVSGPVQVEPFCFTAACIEGFMAVDGRSIPLTLRLGEGTMHESHCVLLAGPEQRRLVVPLGEPASTARYEALLELLTASPPDLKISLSDTLDTIWACAAAIPLIREPASHYEFGKTPALIAPPPPAVVFPEASPGQARTAAPSAMACGPEEAPGPAMLSKR